MSCLRFLVNCVILVICVQRASGHPQGSNLPGDQYSSSTVPSGVGSNDNENSDRRGCACPKNESSVQLPAGLDLSPGLHRFEQTHSRNVLVHGMICSCNLGLGAMPHRDDYRYTPGIGSHKLHTRATVWNSARKLCNEEGGHLAIVNSIAEAHVLMDIFNRSGPVKGATYPQEAFLGIHDLYLEGDWVTVLGDSLAKTGYTVWSDKWGGQPDNGGGRQNCGAFMKEGGLDDVACDVPFPFFCELPVMQFL